MEKNDELRLCKKACFIAFFEKMLLFMKWLVVLLSFLSLSVYAYDGVIKTQFGRLEIKNNILYFNNKQVEPMIEGNNDLAFAGFYTVRGKDIVLLQDTGGVGCPIQLYFVQIKPTLQITEAFGTCSEVYDIHATSQFIQVSMHHYFRANRDNEDDFDNTRVLYKYDTHRLTTKYLK